jgi:tocopherol cyclase
MSSAVPAPAGGGSPAFARVLPYPARRIWTPDVYQGGARRDDYFEGWYLKCVDGARTHPIAFIPGVSHDAAGGTSHSFVQVVRPGGETTYLEYPVEAFKFDPNRFEIAVGPNRFSTAGIVVDIDRDGISVRGEISFGPWRPWPVTPARPGIMGWYRFVPRMECYHAVCSLDHELSGSLEIDGEQLDFSGGRGYAEKDWGRSFPSSWVWAQSNHFDAPGTSVTLSVARIPWMGGGFIGFIAGVLLGEELYRFATYTGARLTAFSSWPGGAKMTLEDRTYRLEAEVDAANPAPLRAPIHGRMAARADESLDAQLRAKLTRLHDGVVLLDDVGLHAGVEVMDEKCELEGGIFRPLTADD